MDHPLFGNAQPIKPVLTRSQAEFQGNPALPTPLATTLRPPGSVYQISKPTNINPKPVQIHLIIYMVIAHNFAPLGFGSHIDCMQNTSTKNNTSEFTVPALIGINPANQ